MILTFPNLDTVRLALTSGALPATVSLAPAVAAFEDDGRVWIEPAADLPRKALAELRRLGAAVVKARGAAPAVEVSCWLQLFPLQRATDLLSRPAQTPVIFELAEAEALAPLVTEVLRLGNDRQGYRWLEDAKGKTPGRALLRVIGPPYYSLLRAIDRDGRSAPVGYVEAALGVWVQLGYRHPLAEHLKPPAGMLLFLRPPRRWATVAEAPFHDIYEVLEFSLPVPKTPWQEGDLGRRLTVPLRLSPGGGSDPAELWVLRDRPLEQLDDLVGEADDTLLARLSFAVGEKDGAKIVVLRVRPSKQAPPALALNAIEFCHFQKMPNLFLPVGTRLHPPLRRDALRRHLVEEPMQVTWLSPGADGTFTPESLPETAFRPLSDWIDYVIDHDHAALQTWVESARFDFEPFVCDEDSPRRRPKQPPGEARARSDAPRRTEFPADAALEEAADGPADDDERPAPEVAPGVRPVPPPDELREELRALEERFLAATGGLDDPLRQPLWAAMAALNARLGLADDAGVCWMNALWLADAALPAQALNWLRAEAQAVPVRPEAGWPKGRTWVSHAVLAPRGAAIPGDDLDRVLKPAPPNVADVRALAAYVFWSSCQKTPVEGLAGRLGPVGQFLETNARALPVRAAWLAALGLHRLAGGDALGLARARDRLLERLFHSGLRAEQDLPSFLRFSGPAGNQRCRAMRQWLAVLAERARQWAERNTSGASPPEARTEAYIDLFFSFGLAKVGEQDASNQLLQKATAALHGEGQAHEFLLNAYAHRVRQAQQGETHPGPLPNEYMETLLDLYKQRADSGDKQGVGDWYIIDRLREQSRILEPDQKIKPYRYMERVQEGAEQTLQRLPDILDRVQAADQVRQLLRKVPKGDRGLAERANILIGALNQAPRIGEEFAREMLSQVPEALDGLPLPRQPDEFERQATLLEKGLFVAAHFDRKDVVPGFVVRFERLLQSQRDAPTVQALDALAAQCFRGLRKLGMQEEIGKLLQQMAEVMLRGGDLKAVQDAEWRAKQPAALRALLHVAGGWYYFGEEAQAARGLEAARAALLTPSAPEETRPLAPGGQELIDRIKLARAYAAALSQAPVEMAQERFEELFDKLAGIRDPWTTSHHYLLSQLLIVEAVVLGVVSDDFTLGPGVRRWLDDDEYLVRRRIHRDVRQVVSQ